MENEDVVRKGARLADEVASALRGADIEVIGKVGGTVIDDKRGGTFATGNVTLSAAGAEAFVQRLTGAAPVGQDVAASVRSALYERHIGGIVSRDSASGNVGLAQLTEGVADAIVSAVQQ
jgi:hypothetical protein